MYNQDSRFAVNPTLNISRSIFNQRFTHKTTFDTGELIPLCRPLEVLPGDTFDVSCGAAIRMTTPIFPVMDDAFFDVYFFFVPSRLLWDHWEEFNGANKSTYWQQPTTYQIPQITSPSGGWLEGTIADHFGLPTKVSNISVSHLPFRAYALIYNEWFRSENVTQPVEVSLGDASVVGSNDGDYVINAQLGAKPLKVSKFFDYFTAALPAPQKGDPISIPGSVIDIMAPVVPGAADHLSSFPSDNMRWVLSGNADNANVGLGVHVPPTSPTNGDRTVLTTNSVSADNVNAVPSNLYANVSGGQSVVTINDLRQALAVQRLLENDARGGTRYTEILRSHFGVVSPDARLQRPEYLGGERIRINMDQVLQTSSTDSTSPQGNTAAYSLTNFGSRSMWVHSFVEHGYVFALGCVRTYHTYQQGIDRLWSRKDRYDFYWPELANIGEQPIYNKEIFAQGNQQDNEVFGYQEAYADYRYLPNQLSGLFRSNASGTLDSWHYADNYSELPILSKSWLDETSVNVARTLAVQDEPQFIGDFGFSIRATRPLPLTSIPGLTGHF